MRRPMMFPKSCMEFASSLSSANENTHLQCCVPTWSDCKRSDGSRDRCERAMLATQDSENCKTAMQDSSTFYLLLFVVGWTIPVATSLNEQHTIQGFPV